jgi:ribosomal protein S18 acetylase RimI-like enzyme
MINVIQSRGHLSNSQRQIVTAGFERHTKEGSVPSYQKERINWLAYESEYILVGVLATDLLWDWIYIDELWVDERYRGIGLGQKLMNLAEEYAISHSLTGLWVWTQSWQAPNYYDRLGYEEFTRFNDFPKGHYRIGFCKYIK